MTFDQLEEYLNTATHALGLVLSLLGLVWLIVMVMAGEVPFAYIGALIFAVVLVVVYFFSTFYHGSPPGMLREILNVADHSAIFLLIGGTYLPFAGAALDLGLSVWTGRYMVLIGICVLLGIACKVFWFDKKPAFATGFYIMMAWVVLLGLQMIIPFLGGDIYQALLGGVIMYSLGAIFFIREKFPLNHSIRHLLVMGGSMFHWIAVYGLLV